MNNIQSNEIIKELRLKHNMTQKELANKIGLTQQAIALIESGKRKIDFDLFLKIIDICGESLDVINIAAGNDIELSQNENMTIGEKIRNLRKEKGLTQKSLGELCGINEANIRKYESNKQNPKVITLKKIADALDVNYLDLLEVESHTRQSDDDGICVLSENDFPLQQIVDVDDTNKKIIDDCYKKLNSDGKSEAAKRIQELSELKKYLE